METEVTKNTTQTSFTDLLKGVSESAGDLFTEEAKLVKTEVGATLRGVGADLRNTIVFGGMFIVALLPFVLFLVYGLGELLGGRYWLSSLIVAIVWGGCTGSVAYIYYKRLTIKNPTLPTTRRALDRSAEAVKNTIEGVKDAVTN